jgi:hypothetical protein
MKQLTLIVSILGVFLAVSGVVFGDELVFVANLSGAQEVIGANGELLPPPQLGIETETTGRLHLSFDPALTRARFRLRVNNGDDITQAHLHCAPDGMNGPIAVFLFPSAPPPSSGEDVNGLLSEGELTNASFLADVDCTATCGRMVNNIASLRAAILDGCIYANVHSVLHGAGVVRGQVRPADRQEIEALE